MDKTTSLLPYLESGRSGILLDIHVTHRDDPQGELPSFPFETAGIKKPFTHLIKGGLKCDGSNRVFQPVFMLLPKDSHIFNGEPFNTQNNTTLDQAWLDTIQFFSQDPGTFSIPDPVGHSPARLKPLFYCKFKHRFFHPPCPDCGRELILCKNDIILEKAGLDSFYTSLSRYLFCPKCYASDSTHFFYTYARKAGSPASVLDRYGLVKRFSQMKTAPNGLPCIGCPEHNVCYQTEQKVFSRIGFLSFYPFYMLVFNACAINGTQFLQGLSNAPSPGGIELPGQDSSKYLFKNTPGFWLEILFLKYAFLTKILSSIEKRLNHRIKPVFNLDMDSIWINTKSDAGMMPFFWDYELYLIDLITARPMDLFQTSTANNRHTNFVAQLCLYIFFVNHKHDVKTIFEAGADLLQNTDETQWTNNAQALFETHPIFKPENIFWEPAPVAMAETWYDLWIQTIHFAGSLIKEKEVLDFPVFIKHCIQKANEISNAIKSEIFSKAIQIKQAPVMPVAGAAGQKDPQKNPTAATRALHEETQINQAITTILKRLKAKWEKEVSPQTIQDEDVMETLVLSSTDEGVPPPTDFPAKDNKYPKPATPSPMMGQHEFEQMQKTMMINRPDNIDPAPSDFEDGQKTIILDARQKTKTPKPEKDFSDLEKTVIMSSRDRSTVKNSDAFFNEDDDLDKTVILPPKK